MSPAQPSLFDTTTPARARKTASPDPGDTSEWDWWHQLHRRLDTYRRQHPERDTPGQWCTYTLDELGMKAP